MKKKEEKRECGSFEIEIGASMATFEETLMPPSLQNCKRKRGERGIVLLTSYKLQNGVVGVIIAFSNLVLVRWLVSRFSCG